MNKVSEKVSRKLPARRYNF